MFIHLFVEGRGLWTFSRLLIHSYLSTIPSTCQSVSRYLCLSLSVCLCALVYVYRCQCKLSMKVVLLLSKSSQDFIPPLLVEKLRMRDTETISLIRSSIYKIIICSNLQIFSYVYILGRKETVTQRVYELVQSPTSCKFFRQQHHTNLCMGSWCPLRDCSPCILKKWRSQLDSDLRLKNNLFAYIICWVL